MPTDPMPDGFRVTVVPTDDGIRRPVTYANTAQIIGDLTGLTIYFFSTPADANNLPDSKKQLAQSKAKDGVATMTLQLDPVAKVFIPLEFSPILLDSLGKSIALWSRLREAASAPETEQKK